MQGTTSSEPSPSHGPSLWRLWQSLQRLFVIEAFSCPCSLQTKTLLLRILRGVRPPDWRSRRRAAARRHADKVWARLRRRARHPPNDSLAPRRRPLRIRDACGPGLFGARPARGVPPYGELPRARGNRRAVHSQVEVRAGPRRLVWVAAASRRGGAVVRGRGRARQSDSARGRRPVGVVVALWVMRWR